MGVPFQRLVVSSFKGLLPLRFSFVFCPTRFRYSGYGVGRGSARIIASNSADAGGEGGKAAGGLSCSDGGNVVRTPCGSGGKVAGANRREGEAANESVF